MQKLGAQALQTEGTAGVKALIDWKMFGMLEEGRTNECSDHCGQEERGQKGRQQPDHKHFTQDKELEFYSEFCERSYKQEI